ncbi:MAG: hypothetical protein AB1698_03555 [Pseudomonadota bacterium]
MSKTFASVLAGAVTAIADRPDVPLAPSAAPAVTAALAEQLPAPQALEALWPQLARYAVSIAGAALASRGWVDAADWQVIAGAFLTLAPPAWRTITTLLARRSA